MSDGSSMCDAGFGLRPGMCGLHYLCLARCGALNARGQKTFLLKLYRLIDTQGRGVHGPDERGLERLFTHNVKLYNCAAGKRGYPNLQYEAVNPQTSVCDGMCATARWDG